MPATFEIITLTAWAPHESQQQPLQPGSASAPGRCAGDGGTAVDGDLPPRDAVDLAVFHGVGDLVGGAAPAAGIAAPQGFQAHQHSDRDQRGDQPILDGRRAAFIAGEAARKAVKRYIPVSPTVTVRRLYSRSRSIAFSGSSAGGIA